MKTAPYLVVTFIESPRENVNTSQAGWMNDPANIKTMEQVSVVDRINKKQKTAPIIINLLNGDVLSNRTNRNDDDIVDHYINRYRDTITNALKVWAMKEIKNGIALGETDEQSEQSNG